MSPLYVSQKAPVNVLVYSWWHLTWLLNYETPAFVGGFYISFPIKLSEMVTDYFMWKQQHLQTTEVDLRNTSLNKLCNDIFLISLIIFSLEREKII